MNMKKVKEEEKQIINEKIKIKIIKNKHELL